MRSSIDFPDDTWIDGRRFENAFSACGLNPLRDAESAVRFRFSKGTKLMVDAAVRLLSMSNQLAHIGKLVTLEFPHDDLSTYEYLNRAAFFEHLRSEIRVLPRRPQAFTSRRYRGCNPGLVEFASLSPRSADSGLPDRLSRALARAVTKVERRTELQNAAFALFAELIGNVHDHSDTELPGFAVLQAYTKGNAVRIAVSDSGKGLLETVKPALASHYPHLVGSSDRDLLTHMLKDGVSRKGKGHGGCGLKVCANHAAKFGANLDVRLPTSRFRAVLKRRAWGSGYATIDEHCPWIWGTHIAFDFQVD